MNPQAIAPSIKASLAEIHARLKEAEQIAKQCKHAPVRGSLVEAVCASFGIEQLIYKAGRLHDAAPLRCRLAIVER